MSVTRAPLSLCGLILLPCYFTEWGQVVPRSSQVVRVDMRQLFDLMPSGQWQYATPGDYVGLLRKEGGQVDFQITGNHPNMAMPPWQRRVVALWRVVKLAHTDKDLRR